MVACDAARPSTGVNLFIALAVRAAVVTDTIQVCVAVPTCARCPVGSLSERTPVREVRVDRARDRIDFIAEETPADPPSELEFVEFADRAHGRYDLDDGTADCSPETADPPREASGSDAADGSPDRSGCGCDGFPPAFAELPVSPRETRVEDGELVASFVLAGYDELRAVLDAFGGADVRHVLVDGDRIGEGPDVVPVDLGEVTERQASVAAVAVSRGYFDPDGASTEEIAEELGLAKSTVSEHLRLVTATVLSQVFDDRT
jgi:hypothetical protein